MHGPRWMALCAMGCCWQSADLACAGIPEALILALRDTGVRDLTIASNNAGVDGWDSASA